MANEEVIDLENLVLKKDAKLIALRNDIRKWFKSYWPKDDLCEFIESGRGDITDKTQSDYAILLNRVQKVREAGGMKLFDCMWYFSLGFEEPNMVVFGLGDETICAYEFNAKQKAELYDILKPYVEKK